MTKPRRDEKLIKLCAERLRTEREKRFRTAAAFAAEVGVEVGTYRHHENGTRAFERSDAQKYARKLKVSAAYLMDLAGGDGATETFEVSIMGEAALTIWHDRSLDLERNKNKDTLPIPNPTGSAVRYAILIKDESVNKALPAGEYAVCVPIRNDGDITAGMLVDVEHTRGNLVQRTIRRVIAKTKGGFQLKTYSSLAQFESSLPYPSDDVSILGRVIGHYGEFDLIKN